MQIDLGFLIANWWPVLAVTFSLMLLKMLVVLIMIRLAQPTGTAIKTALALAQGGGFSFAIFATASGNGLIPTEINQILIIAVVFSMVLTPFILKNLSRIAALLESKPETTVSWPTGEPSIEKNRLVVCGSDSCTTVELEHNHLVVCGYGKLGRSVMRELRKLNYPCLAIEHHRQTVQEGIERGDAVIFGNAAQRTILEKALVQDAAAVIIALEDHHAIRLVSQAVAETVQTPLIVVRVSGELERELIHNIPIKSFVEEHREVAKMLIDHALTCETVAPYVPKVCRECIPDQYGTVTEKKQMAINYPRAENVIKT